jgi:hypothetical protein
VEWAEKKGYLENRKDYFFVTVEGERYLKAAAARPILGMERASHFRDEVLTGAREAKNKNNKFKHIEPTEIESPALPKPVQDFCDARTPEDLAHKNRSRAEAEHKLAEHLGVTIDQMHEFMRQAFRDF